MLVSLLEIDNKIIYTRNDIVKDYLIISYRNTVLNEDDNNMGLSYLVDSLVFNELCEVFEEQIEIKSDTGYEISRFEFCFNGESGEEIIFKILDFLNTYCIDESYVEILKKDQQSEINHNQKQKIDNSISYQLTGNRRYCYSIKGTKDSLEKLSVQEYNSYYKNVFLPNIKIVICTNNYNKYSRLFDISDSSGVKTVKETECAIENNQSCKNIDDENDSSGEVCLYHRFSSNTIKDVIAEELLCECIRFKTKDLIDKLKGYVVLIRDVDFEYLNLKLFGSAKEAIKILRGLFNNIYPFQIDEDELKRIKSSAGKRLKNIFSDIHETADELSWNKYYRIKYGNDYFINPESCYDSISISDLESLFDEMLEINIESSYSEKDNEIIKEIINSYGKNTIL